MNKNNAEYFSIKREVFKACHSNLNFTKFKYIFQSDHALCIFINFVTYEFEVSL